MSWHIQRLCTDVGDYELVVEKQKKLGNVSKRQSAGSGMLFFMAPFFPAALRLGKRKQRKELFLTFPKTMRKLKIIVAAIKQVILILLLLKRAP